MLRSKSRQRRQVTLPNELLVGDMWYPAWVKFFPSYFHVRNGWCRHFDEIAEFTTIESQIELDVWAGLECMAVKLYPLDCGRVFFFFFFFFLWPEINSIFIEPGLQNEYMYQVPSNTSATSSHVLKPHWLLLVIQLIVTRTRRLWDIIGLIETKQSWLLRTKGMCTMTLWQPWLEQTERNGKEMKLRPSLRGNSMRQRYDIVKILYRNSSDDLTKLGRSELAPSFWSTLLARPTTQPVAW